MSTTLAINEIQGVVTWDNENVLTLGNTVNSNSFASGGSTLTNGTGANQADTIYATTTTIAAAGTLNLNLNSTPLTGFFAQNCVFARVKILYIELQNATAASTITIGAAATHPFVSWLSGTTPAVVVRNGGFILLYAPDATAYTVTSASSDQLLITNNDASNVATLRIAIVGASV